MTIEDSLQAAIESARDGCENYLTYTFETPAGAVDFFAQVVLEGDTELRALLASGKNLGYAGMYVQGKRTAGSSSANVGKIVDIRRRREK